MIKGKEKKIIVFAILLLSVIGTVCTSCLFNKKSDIKTKDEDNYSQEIHWAAGSETGEKGFKDGKGSEVRMYKPIRLATLNDSTIIFADIFNHAIRSISLDGKVTTLAGGPDKQGYQDGVDKDAKFDSPHGVAVREDGVIAVAEANNNTIRLLTPIKTTNGKITYMITTLAGVAGKNGMLDGKNEIALFDSPHSVIWGKKGEIYVADIGNSRIRMIYDGETTTVAGRDAVGKIDGDLVTGTLNYPMDIISDKNENIWIVDAGSMTIRKWNAEEGLSTPFPKIEFEMPHGISLIENRLMIVAEMNGHRIVGYDIATGKVITIAGTSEEGLGYGKLSKPAAVLVNKDKIWIADLGNHRIVHVDIPKIDK